jgi:hypothetical protein
MKVTLRILPLGKLGPRRSALPTFHFHPAPHLPGASPSLTGLVDRHVGLRVFCQRAAVKGLHRQSV